MTGKAWPLSCVLLICLPASLNAAQDVQRGAECPAGSKIVYDDPSCEAGASYDAEQECCSKGEGTKTTLTCMKGERTGAWQLQVTGSENIPQCKPAASLPGSGQPTSGGTVCLADNPKADPNGTANRDLDGAYRNSQTMTNQACLAFCAGYKFAATQYGSWCFCGNSHTFNKTEEAGTCNMPCAGDSKQICGGSWSNSVTPTGH